jgi:hypothetical protein
MAYQLDYDTANKIMRISADGVMTDEALLGGYSALRTCNASYSPSSCIMDYTKVRKVALSNNAIRLLAKEPPALSIERLQVTVVPEQLMFGFARMFQALSYETRPNLRVVRSLEEALSLIGVKSPTFSPIYISLPRGA